jgi:membrane-bound lytic murein transglycosylase C
MKKIIVLLLCIEIMIGNSDFDSFKKEQEAYLQEVNQEFETYKKAYDDAYNSFKDELSEFWPTQEVTNKDKWVQYSPDLKNKKMVDFKNGVIKLETIGDSEEEAKENLKKLLGQLKDDTTISAYKGDQIEQKILKTVPENRQKIENLPIVQDVFKPEDIEKEKEKLSKQKLVKKEYKKKTIYEVQIPMPSDYILKKASTYKTRVISESKKSQIPPKLIYAIMHSESSFNPMARSHIPAFGLMQIVPNSAGKDVAQFLSGKKQAPSSSFLYDADNNILYGSTYLRILYYRYLASIKDPVSRLYCTIAAYNTGAGNVARTFTGSTNIKKASEKINQLTSQEVYGYLERNLPYDETKKYLKKVNGRLAMYENFLNK